MTKWDISAIKRELQGNSGLIKLIRKKFIPNTVEMSQLAQRELMGLKQSLSTVDSKLDWLLLKEYEIFLGKQQELVNRFVELADFHSKDDSFPVTREIISEFRARVQVSSNPTTELEGIIGLIVALADSNRQSRVSRSGSSLMHHIAFLLDSEGFVYGKDYQREFVLNSGCLLDFFFPNEAAYTKEPKDCVSVACQTTSNDRFRLTFAQMPENTRNRACTAIGNKNFGEKLGPDSLTDTKLEEAKKEGVKFVIIGSAINNRLRNSQAVMSYEEWFDELKRLKPFWH